MPNELELYPHNEKAYRKLLDMLSETRRACIIHPTGTGKAFIAYRYAFDHPKERILWMSPSTYIEQEQEASIRRELPNHEFKNIERMTYQTAMHRAQKGNLDIHADTVIFDDYGMDYAVLNYGINDVGIQDLKESGFKPVYSDNLTVCLKRSTV